MLSNLFGTARRILFFFCVHISPCIRSNIVWGIIIYRLVLCVRTVSYSKIENWPKQGNLKGSTKIFIHFVTNWFSSYLTLESMFLDMYSSLVGKYAIRPTTYCCSVIILIFFYESHMDIQFRLHASKQLCDVKWTFNQVLILCVSWNISSNLVEKFYLPRTVYVCN